MFFSIRPQLHNKRRKSNFCQDHQKSLKISPFSSPQLELLDGIKFYKTLMTSAILKLRTLLKLTTS